MNKLRWNETGFEDRIRAIETGSSLFDPVIEQRVRDILGAVRDLGDTALLAFTQRFDGASLTAPRLAVNKAELLTASLKADAALRDAVERARTNIASFSEHGLRREWSAKNGQGATVGEKFDPFQRVGIYIPGGTAPLVSTALMTITLAKVAGCPEIVVCTPCDGEGGINPALLFAVNVAGATEIYRLGGAQAIAALAYGTETIRPVSKVFGPGNAYVVAAKRLLFGRVAIDLLPGPSEVLIVADDTADARFVAADLLAQAEHGSGHERVWLLSDSARVIRGVEREIDKQLKTLTRADMIRRALASHGWLIQVQSLDQAVSLANRFAPEHCELMTRKARALARRIVTAGAVFIGPNSPTVLGDYVAGPSHTLPTGGAGACFAGLTVDQFQRRTSVVEYTAAALKRSVGTVEQFAAMEGLDAHGRSASIRLAKSKRGGRK